MPQLDLTTYSSQVFWFALCFITLYLTAWRVILPRISAIINNRKNIIDADLALAKDLDDKIYAIESATDQLRKEATKKYQQQLEEASRAATKQREQMIEDLKTKIDQDLQQSKQQLKDLIEKSRQQSEVAIKNLTQQVANKLLSQ